MRPSPPPSKVEAPQTAERRPNTCPGQYRNIAERKISNTKVISQHSKQQHTVVCGMHDIFNTPSAAAVNISHLGWVLFVALLQGLGGGGGRLLFDEKIEARDSGSSMRSRSVRKLFNLGPALYIVSLKFGEPLLSWFITDSIVCLDANFLPSFFPSFFNLSRALLSGWCLYIHTSIVACVNGNFRKTKI